MDGMNADEDTDEENGNRVKAKGFWYNRSPFAFGPVNCPPHI